MGWRQRRQSRAKALRVTTRCRRICAAAGMGLGGGPGLVVLFPSEPEVLEDGKGDHRQERVVVQAPPAAALEVVEAEFFLHPLVHPRRPSGL